MDMRSGPHRKRIIVTAIVLAAALVFSVSITAYAMSAHTIIILDDGEELSFTTIKSDADEILRVKSIELNEKDYLDLSEYSEEEDGTIRVYRAKNVWVEDDGVRTQYDCAGWVGRLLEETGITLGERDEINLEKHVLLEEGLEVIIKRAFDVEVQDDGKSHTISLTEGTVADALELVGVTLEGDDFVTPGPETALTPGETIHVNRVDYKDRVETKNIDFEVETRNDDDMYIGQSVTEQAGEKGETKITYNDKYVNGARVESNVVEEVVVKEPVKQIRIVGTRPMKLQSGLKPISTLKLPKSVDIVDGKPTHYKYKITGLAKAYCTGKTTASGLKPKPGYIAVDPKQIPYGTKLWIVTNDGKYVYGYAIAADTGGFVKQRSCMIDVYVMNETMARQWGNRDVTVYVLDEPRMQMPYGG